MTAPSGIRASAGFRHAQILQTDANGYPNSSASQVYEGVNIHGAKTLTLNEPEPRMVNHVGDDGIIALDVLPALEPLSGELQIATTDDALTAAVSGGLVQFTGGNSSMMAMGVTDKKGSESQVIVLAYRESLDEDPASATFGTRFWDWRLLPKAWLVERDNTFDINSTNETRTFTMRPNIVTKLPWGVTLSGTTHGTTKAQGIRGLSDKRPHLVGFTGNGSATNFLLPNNYPIDTAATNIYVLTVNGSASTVVNSASSLDRLAFSGAIPDLAKVVCLYGTSGTA